MGYRCGRDQRAVAAWTGARASCRKRVADPPRAVAAPEQQDRGSVMAIDFMGYTADCVVKGSIPLADDRLSDMLNSVARIVVRGAVVEDLIVGGHAGPIDLPVPCGEFLVVVGTGRRGVESQRRRTLRRAVKVGLGRFVASGFLHVEPAAHAQSLSGSPDALLVGRDLLVPLTDAVLTYDRHDGAVEERHETILINRARASWIDAVDDEPEVDEPGATSDASTRTRYVKDFTGTVAD